MKLKKCILALTVLLLSFLLCGCLMKSVSDLYELPQQSAEYRAIQLAVEEALPIGAQFISPMNGSNLQSMQMVDFDGDGQEEIIVFVMASGEKPLKVYIFDLQDSGYENICIIESSGRYFDRVDYAQMDGLGGNEIILGRRVSNVSAQIVDVYSIADGKLVQQMTAEYSEYLLTDLNSDDKSDLFLTNFDRETYTGIAEVYHHVNGEMQKEPALTLSMRESGLRRIHTGRLTSQDPAVFVSGVLENGSAVTDAFGFMGGIFVPISSQRHLELVSTPVQGYNVFATDYDGDGVMEFPQVIQLNETDETPGETTYQAILWYEYDRQKGKILDGATYHHYSSGWFFTIPTRLGTDFTVERNASISGVSGLTFYKGREKTPANELFSVFAFTGAGRNVAVSENSCFILSVRNETVYAARLGEGADAVRLTQEELAAMFNFIQVDWNSGET